MKPKQRCSSAFLLALVTLLGGCEELPNVPPQATFVFNPVSPIYAGETAVVFNASGSRDSDGSINSFVWDFGDGTTEVTVAGPVVSHVFRDTPASCVQITYAVLLTVVDNRGERGTVSGQVSVSERAASGACPP